MTASSGLKLLNGSYVSLADGSFCGPVAQIDRGHFKFHGFVWAKSGHETSGNETHRVVAVHSTIGSLLGAGQ